jgi:hypothetical protein
LCQQSLCANKAKNDVNKCDEKLFQSRIITKIQLLDKQISQ